MNFVLAKYEDLSNGSQNWTKMLLGMNESAQSLGKFKQRIGNSTELYSIIVLKQWQLMMYLEFYYDKIYRCSFFPYAPLVISSHISRGEHTALETSGLENETVLITAMSFDCF